ncbi:SPOR domain-containing protein [Aureimonas mangrovi]|uniref:SPOR domain-containing protein n=1 Tax=Aureimonas mangrovi TaxID=2758041 RepID=UPI00163D87BC|nr:SPOR domain-containing protein [Aureimonas mangrovi]
MSGYQSGRPGAGETAEDPFADLVEMIEGPQGMGAHRGTQPAHRASGRRPIFTGEEPTGVEVALMDLAEPAAPRVSRPAETAAFAPERHEEFHEAAVAPRTNAQDDFDRLIASELAALQATPVYTQPAFADPYDAHEYDAHEHVGEYEQDAYAYGYEAGGYEPYEADEDGSHYAAVPDAGAQAPAAVVARKRLAASGGRGRRAMFFAGGVAAVALVGVFGLWAGSGVIAGATGSGEPILIRADSEPVKIAPVDPGGRVVPNQNNAVFERSARGGPSQPLEQDMLISAAEQPLDISFDDTPSNLPGVMVGAPELPDLTEMASLEELEGAQVAQAAPEPAAPSLQPHRVRTYDVRPDGTLVPREPAAEAAPAAEPETTGTVQPTLPYSTQLPPATAESPAPALEETQPAAPAESTAAIAEPAPTPPPADAFFVQISSQPSQELAQQSMSTLSSRFASAIGGRGMSIQTAEIPDRGTYYRVRITTASREEANQVCANVQSAGGSCFVTR